MFLYNDKQNGLGLLELLLVLLIAALLAVLGLRTYQKQRMYQNLKQTTQYAQLVLHAVNQYYYTYCAQNIDPDKNNPVLPHTEGYQKAVEMLSNPMLSVESLQSADKYGHQFLSSNFHPYFTFGKFTDKKTFHVALVKVPFSSNQCASASKQSKLHANCFGQTYLWQSQVSACVTEFTTVKRNKKTKKKIYTLPNKTNIRSLLHPDEIQENALCKHGLVVVWKSIPRVHSEQFSNQGDAIESADQEEFNQQYRYGPWMQQGNLANGPLKLKDRLQYLCQ